MPDQILIGNFGKGLKHNRKAFNIDNDAFAYLFNFYVWRGQLKRKRGTSELARLERQVESKQTPLPWQYKEIVLDSDSANLIVQLNLQTGSSITPGSIDLFLGTDEYTEPSPPDGTLLKNGIADPGSSINYATGVITIAGGGAGFLIGFFSYFPDLPVLGLEDFIPNQVTDTENSDFPELVAFDTTYAYQLNQSGTPFFYSVSYYKGTNNPVIWSNFDYAQFWSTNYQSAMWVTNNKPGFHIVNGAYVAGSGTTDITFTFTYPSFSSTPGVPYQNLIVGDKLWFNEWPAGSTINPDTNVNTVGTVLTIVNKLTGTYIVRFAAAKTASGTGIAELLTNSIPGQDGIRWYDGDPTSGTGLPTTPASPYGWVNFSPPLSQNPFTIDDQTADIYYLVGALTILPFKDRLLFFSPWIQTSTGNPIKLEEVVIWSWNGTPYYNALVPTVTNSTETFDARAYWEDQTGFGGNLPAGIDKPIATTIFNEDVILVGFGGTGKKTRFVYTGNDLQPFLFYLINSEMPSTGTFSAITVDRGGIDVGNFGICLTTQQSAERIDLDIPNSVFEIQALNHGHKRVNAIRNFFREWIYFSYPIGDGREETSSWRFPMQSFLFNYRDNTWAIFRENYTHHGTFRREHHYTWETLPFKTWNEWREPWNAGSSTALFSDVIAGNPQGYVLIKDTEGTGEAPSGAISALADDGNGFTQVTSHNHCVNSESALLGTGGDYLYFSNAIGTTTINGKIGLVSTVIDVDNFVVDIPFDGGTYLGLGTYTRLCQPEFQTRQFPFYWEQGKKTRLGVQKYLLDTTASGQVTLEIFLNQDPELPYNYSNIVPDGSVDNSSLEYSQILYTCPESTNLGLLPASVNMLDPANTNQQMPTASSQTQIWHRVNTSLIGDTVQVGITLSDDQMRDLTFATAEITLHGIQLNVSPSQQLS